MDILFHKVWCRFCELSSRDDTWASPSTPAYIVKDINSSPDPHRDAFTHVIVLYDYQQPRSITFRFMYEYNTKFNMHIISPRKFDIFKLNVYRTGQYDSTSTIHLFLLKNRTIFPRKHKSNPYVTFEAYAVVERVVEGQRHFIRTYVHAKLVTVATVSILAYFGTIDRSFCHLLAIFRFGNYQNFRHFQLSLTLPTQ